MWSLYKLAYFIQTYVHIFYTSEVFLKADCIQLVLLWIHMYGCMYLIDTILYYINMYACMAVCVWISAAVWMALNHTLSQCKSQDKNSFISGHALWKLLLLLLLTFSKVGWSVVSARHLWNQKVTTMSSLSDAVVLSTFIYHLQQRWPIYYDCTFFSTIRFIKVQFGIILIRRGDYGSKWFALSKAHDIMHLAVSISSDIAQVLWVYSTQSLSSNILSQQKYTRNWVLVGFSEDNWEASTNYHRSYSSYKYFQIWKYWYGEHQQLYYPPKKLNTYLYPNHLKKQIFLNTFKVAYRF